MSPQLDDLVPLPLPELIKRLGLGIADANKALAQVPIPPDEDPAKTRIYYTIPYAEIDMKISISHEKTTAGNLGLGGSIFGFTVNAGFSGSFKYSAEGSTTIKIQLQAVPLNAAPANPAATAVEEP